MDTLTTLLMQTACRSTHHKLAVDALWQIRHPAATAWRNLFLTQYRAYLRGAKAPDDEFKDFRNHVLHVAQNNWGGAVPTAGYWYDQTVAALRGEDWTTAAFNAGVLSHYYSDPHMPLHTSQSEAETNMHRAAEWSVTKSYDQLRRLIDESGRWPTVDCPRGGDWLGQMVVAGAELSHPHYETLVREYDLARGVLDPVRGWNDRCRRVLADLLAHAIVGLARILERAIDEAGVAPPETSPALEVFLATVNQPIRAVLNKIADVRERAQIEAMFHELQTTGRVEEHLSEEQRVIRSEIAAYRAQQPKIVKPKSAPRPVVTPAIAKTVVAKPTPIKPAIVAPAVVSMPEPKPVMKAEQKPELKVGAATLAALPSAEKPPRYRLELTDLLERAPSIGPKTANRLLAHGWRTVGEFLAADPADVSKKLNSSWASAEVVADWQKQAWLVLQIAELSGTAAQLLVGAGYPTVADVAAAEAAELVCYMAEYSQTGPGQRILRDGKIPDQITAARWIAAARGRRTVSLQKKSA